MAYALPPALLDLTLQRISVHFANNLTPRCLGARAMHQAALAFTPDIQYQPIREPQTFGRIKRRPKKTTGSLAVRPGEGIIRPPSELERRVQILEETIKAEESVVDVPSFSEGELLTIYENLLALPPTEDIESKVTSTEVSQVKEDEALVDAVDRRLSLSVFPEDPPSLRFSDSLKSRSQVSKDTFESFHSALPLLDSVLHPYQRVLTRLQDIITRMENLRSYVMPSQQDFVAISILSKAEFTALTRTCIQAHDGEAAELSLDLIRRSGVPLPEDLVNYVLKFYSNNGQVSKAEHFLVRFLKGPPTEQQRHLHVKAHLISTPPNTIPNSALAALHSYESQSLPAPMSTYTNLITSLFSVPSSISRAQAWDLFSHMRYVAHPTPDAVLYTLMIRACASPLTSRSEPERALDLWTEMTVDQQIAPLAGTYNAIILACARSGSKMYVNEAFRLAKEMLDAHRDAHGRSAFRPDGKTFAALLEGAKRVGDLARARWILAELVREDGKVMIATEDENGFVDAAVNEEVMMHVFHAYASYKAPFKRTAAVLVDGQPFDQQSSEPDVSETKFEPFVGLPTADRQPAFSHLPPQSRTEVIAEAKALFGRILEDQDPGKANDLAPQNTPFRKVEITSRLLNSYISVHYAHASLEAAQELFWTLFEQVNVERNVRSYVEALERCAAARKGSERAVAIAFAEKLWPEWQNVENASQPQDELPSRLSARMIERAHAAMIRILSLTNNVDRAIDHLKTFFHRYPPAHIKHIPQKPALRSTRTVLVGARPLVRMMTDVDIPDDDVPPLMTFNDLEILHHRLVSAGRVDDLAFIKYLCKAYEAALRIRRDGTMKAVPAKTDIL